MSFLLLIRRLTMFHCIPSPHHTSCLDPGTPWGSELNQHGSGVKIDEAQTIRRRAESELVCDQGV